MKPKTLMMLAGITLVVIIGAIFFGQEREDKPVRSGELVFPGLMNSINDIAEMTIETKEETVILAREYRQWHVKGKGGYPAAFGKIKPVLIGMAELRIREPKTKNPDLYEKLGLQDKDAEGSSSSLITLKTKDGNVAASLLLGNQGQGKGTPNQSEMYIRKPEDPQTWLVTGKLPIEKVPEEWLEKDLFKIASKRVQRVYVTHPGGETLKVFKDTPDALDFKVRDLPEGKKVSSQFNVNNVVTTLAQLSMEDVKRSDELEFSSKSGVQAVLETFDGLRLTVETMNKDDVVYSKMAAAFDPALVYRELPKEDSKEKKDASVEMEIDSAAEVKESDDGNMKTDGEKEEKESDVKESVLKSEEEVQKEVSGLNEIFKDWLFELPKFKVDNFSKKKNELLAKE